MPQRVNRGSWTIGDPRAKAAGAKGGKTMRHQRSPEYIAGYAAGWMAAKRSQRVSEVGRIVSASSAEGA